MLLAIAALVMAYAIGSLPVPYIAGRLLRGVDIREHGSGNVGASNVSASVSRVLLVPVGIAQIAQGCAGVLIARVLDQNAGVQVAGGLAAVAAHNWNPWLGFQGGRGVGPAIGVMLALSLPVLACFALIATAGAVTRRVPEFMLAAILSMPITAFAAGTDAAITAGFSSLALLLVLKRLMANSAPEAGPRRVWLNRLVYDRDVRDRSAWLRRDGASARPRS